MIQDFAVKVSNSVCISAAMSAEPRVVLIVNPTGDEVASSSGFTILGSQSCVGTRFLAPRRIRYKFKTSRVGRTFTTIPKTETLLLAYFRHPCRTTPILQNNVVKMDELELGNLGAKSVVVQTIMPHLHQFGTVEGILSTRVGSRTHPESNEMEPEGLRAS